MATTTKHQLVSITDAAEVLAVSTRTVRRYIADGHLDAVRLGRKTLRIKTESIGRFTNAVPVGGWGSRSRVTGAPTPPGATTTAPLEGLFLSSCVAGSAPTAAVRPTRKGA